MDATELNLVMMVGWPGLRSVHLAAWGGYADVVGHLLEAGAGSEVVAGGESLLSIGQLPYISLLSHFLVSNVDSRMFENDKKISVILS